MRIRSWLAELLGCADATRIAVPAAVPPPPAAPGENRQWAAHAAFDAGKAAFDAQDYAAARDYFMTAIELRHDDADAHFYLGLNYRNHGAHEDAADCFQLAIHYRPRFAKALYYLALTAHQLADPGLAIDCLEKAIAIEPAFSGAHNALGYLLITRLGNVERGGEHVRTALRLDPTDPDILCNLGLVLVHEGRTEEALGVCDRLLRDQPKFHEARLNRALAMLALGRYDAAWPDYEARKLVRGNYIPRPFVFAEWDGESLAGKTILVYGEQGIGDEIMFASCVPDIMERAGKCIVDCSPRLESLFRRSFAQAKIHSAMQSAAAIPWLAQCGSVDYQTAIGSLPRFFRRQWTDYPHHAGYLRADPLRIAYWRGRLRAAGAGIKIGISWRGGAAPTRRDLRSTRLLDWLPVLQTPGCDFICLQYGHCGAELAAISNSHDVRIHHWQEAIDDLDETAALLSALDLVISVQTAVVHLGGALAKRTWALVPAVPEWRYLRSGETMPWYPSVRLLRQARIGDWSPVFDRIARDLARLEKD